MLKQNSEQFNTIVEDVTELDWTIVEAKPTKLRLAAVSYKIEIEYIDDWYQFTFDDLSSTEGDSKLGPIRNNVQSEFQSFVKNVTETHIR